MALTFRDAPQFMKETLAVTAAALVAGVAAVLILPPAGASAAGAAALFGGSIAAALSRKRPENPFVRALLGLCAGGLSAFGFLLVANVFGFGAIGLLAGGGLGGLALAGLLGAEENGRRAAQVAGLASAALVGTVGVAALDNIHRFAVSEDASRGVTTVAMSALFGLWVAAAAGVRRLDVQKDPLWQRYDELMSELVEPVRSKVKDALEAYSEIGVGISKDAQMSTETADEARKQAHKLADSVLETAHTYKQIHGDLNSPRLAGIADKLKDLETRIAATNDTVTQGHLQRAAQALQAQRTAVEGLMVGCERAEAAIDAQSALLERLRLAVAQHRVSDRERFAVEVSAVADQASRLSDDLEHLSQAIAEAEALSDRKILADLERAGRRALQQLDGAKTSGATDQTVDHRADQSVVHKA